MTDVERLKADLCRPNSPSNPPASPIQSEWQPFLLFRALLRRLVDDRPKLPQLANGIGELLRIDRLHHVRIGPQLVTSRQVRFLT